MGPQNTSTQIEPFSFAAYNGRGSGCPTSPVWTTVENNLGAFRVIQPQNKCSDPKLALGRAKLDLRIPEDRTHEGTTLFPYLYLYFLVFISLIYDFIISVY